jgi:integrase
MISIQTQRASAKMRNAAIISIFYSTGLRLNEVADLKVGDIDLDTGRVDSFHRRQK